MDALLLQAQHDLEQGIENAPAIDLSFPLPSTAVQCLSRLKATRTRMLKPSVSCHGYLGPGPFRPSWQPAEGPSLGHPSIPPTTVIAPRLRAFAELCARSVCFERSCDGRDLDSKCSLREPAPPQTWHPLDMKQTRSSPSSFKGAPSQKTRAKPQFSRIGHRRHPFKTAIKPERSREPLSLSTLQNKKNLP